MAEKRTRRSKKELIEADIAKVETRIAEYTNKIAELTETKENLKKELKEITDAEDKAKQENEQKEIIALIKKKGLTLDEVKEMLESEPTTK